MKAIHNSKGDENYGREHIDLRHGEEIEKAGYDSVEDFVSDISENYNEIRKGDKGALLLIKRNGKNKVGVIKLKPNDTGDFYNVESAYLSRKGYIDKKDLLYSVKSTPNENAVNSPDFKSERQQDSTEQPSPTSKSKSSTTNIQKNTKNANQDFSHIKPIGKGFFGNIYDQFKGKAKEAVAFLMQNKEGEAIGALNHKDVGDIDLVWGNEKAGLKKIADKHPNMLDDLQGRLNGMEVVSSSENRIILESDDTRAVVSKNVLDEDSKNWLLTAYETKKNIASDSSIDIESEPSKGKQNGTATPQSNVSNTKIQKESETDENNFIKEKIGRLFDVAQKVKNRVVKEFIRPVTKDEVKTIKEKTGIEIDEDFEHTIDNSAINHVLTKHGNEKTEEKQGQLPITKQDFKLVPDIIDNYDTVERGNKNERGLDTVVYTKTYADGTTYVVEEVRTGRKELALNTMYKRKKSGGFMPTDNSTLPLTSETTPDSANIQKESETDDFWDNLDDTDDEVPFSLADNQKPFETDNKEVATLESLQKAFPDAEVVQSESDLPKPVKDTIKRQKAEGRVKGVYHDDKVYIVADNVKTIGEATGTYRHEMFGHKGVIEHLGNNLKDYIHKIVNKAYGKKLKVDLQQKVGHNL